ncbi:restriction endonuclease subunit S [Cellulomonas sp. KH9]|uniref:restriction endonuclease subunit S n=1 Tax=Cellulomonas sp. KH9 TaxID=1855324 RepID=UPI0008E5BD87|nr:restriction endonuclease subunit S [Cellulomonas sp. KH9]SFK12448.1 type I restriction enzyme, S subunit [Cellulomonas sp. KH9]
MTWRTRRVGDLASLFNGFPFDAATFSSTEEMPLVRIRDLLADEFETYIPVATAPGGALLRNDDVVVGMDGDFNVQLWRRGTAALNQRLCALRSRADCDPRFLAYALPRHLKVINDLTYATTVKHLSSWQVAHIAIPAPDIEEQRAIADFLDEQTSRIDTLIAKQTQLITTLRERRSAVVTRAVTRGLNGASLVETRNPFLPQIPEGWSQDRFGREIAVNEGQVDPSADPWAAMTLVAPNHIEGGTGRILGRESAAEQGADSGKYLATSGQILFSKIRPALNKIAIAVEDCLCSADMYPLSSRKGSDHRFIAHWMRATPFHNYVSVMSARVKMPKINREELAAAPWARPPRDEQRQIVTYLDDRLATIDLLIERADRHIALAKERRTALITATVAGQIDVRTTGRATQGVA